jgi:hypothetical protein
MKNFEATFGFLKERVPLSIYKGLIVQNRNSLVLRQVPPIIIVPDDGRAEAQTKDQIKQE